MIGEFVAHDSSPHFRGLNHDPRAGLNVPSVRRHLRLAFGANRTSTGRQNRLDRSRMTPSRRQVGGNSAVRRAPDWSSPIRYAEDSAGPGVVRTAVLDPVPAGKHRTLLC
jgi:hypothetical protein